MKKTWKIAGINFDHMHMRSLLKQVSDCPNAEIAAVCHRERSPMEGTLETHSIADERVFTNVKDCLETTRPDIVILCPSTADHANAVEEVAPYGVHILLEKPFAADLSDADRIITAMKDTGKQLMINWPLRWYPCHVTAKRLVDEGMIGDVRQVHYMDGNRGPLPQVADKKALEPKEKSESWFYQKAAGGGSLLDYLGYGTTLGTWFHGGKTPTEVTSMTDIPTGLEVDEHSISVVRYDTGLSKYETRWGTFTDPWILQPQPKCGFVIVGTAGTISSYDYENVVRVQTEANPETYEIPVDTLEPPFDGPINYFVDCLENDRAVDGPLSPDVCRIGQWIVDAAARSAELKRTVSLSEFKSNS